MQKSYKQTCQSINIWIDLENTPHVPFFLPIVRSLRKQGHKVTITARDGYQTCEMADFKSLDYKRIGRHYGRHISLKICGGVLRAMQLMPYAFKKKPDLVINLGSRSQNLTARLMRIPIVEIMDYEHTTEPSLLKARWYMVPDVLNLDRFVKYPPDRIFSYHGLKEDVYITDFRPDKAIVGKLELGLAKIVVTIRPAASEAHYHNPESDELFIRLIDRIISTPDIKAVILPRNRAQENHFRVNYPHWFDYSKVIIPRQVVDGLNLIWHSDLVVGAGGTMNREAAAMGIPVYSIFRGRIGAVDRWLCENKRMVLIESNADLDRKILLQPRMGSRRGETTEPKAFSDIISNLDKIIDSIRRTSVASSN